MTLFEGSMNRDVEEMMQRRKPDRAEVMVNTKGLETENVVAKS